MLTLIEFVWIWNRIQRQKIPAHHVRICRFLSGILQRKNSRRGLLMAFRNSGKSTLVGLFCAWILTLNPNARILILSADYALAKKMTRNIKKILEMHPAARHLLPAKRDEWAGDRFAVKRSRNLRDPSVLARGISGNVTGCRADVIICDDVEVPRNSDSANKRADLRQKLSELDYVLTPNGVVLYVGTPHTADTIYDASDVGFLNGFQVLKIPILNAAGESNWPERFSVEKISEIKKRSGAHKFLSQMMLAPVAAHQARLAADLIKYYAHELVYTERNGVAELTLGDVKLRSVSCWWDPSFASEKSQDNSVIACVFSDGAGRYYVHEVKYLSVPAGAESATWQCAAVADFAERNFIPAVHLETNGLGKFLPAVLRREIANRHQNCSVIEAISKQKKAERILSAFDAPLLNGALFAHASLKESAFVAEMREWTPTAKIKDDGLDAVAGCLLNEPVRLSRLPVRHNTKKEWRF